MWLLRPTWLVGEYAWPFGVVRLYRSGDAMLMVRTNGGANGDANDDANENVREEAADEELPAAASDVAQLGAAFVPQLVELVHQWQHLFMDELPEPALGNESMAVHVQTRPDVV